MKTKLSRARVNVFFQGAYNEPIATEIREMLRQIVAAKKAAIKQEQTEARRIQEVCNSF
jgi:hypothetical protein